MTKISQREARRLRKRVEELETAQRNRIDRWNSDYPGGVNVMTVHSADAVGRAIISTALALGHTIVVKVRGDAFMYYAVKP